MRQNIQRLGGKAFVAGLCVVAASSAGARADDFVVTSLADTDGASCGADCTLRQALRSAHGRGGGDTISFAVAGTIRLGRELPILSGDLTIRNAQSATVTISGENAHRVFMVINGANVTLDRLIISAGSAPGAGNAGAGIFNNGILTLTNSTLSGNNSSFGSGLYNLGTLTMSNCTVSDNKATLAGGGVGVGPRSQATISQSRFSSNVADGGGAVANYGALTLSECDLTRNTGRIGGGIFNVGTLSLSGSQLTGNMASQGGGGIENGDFGRGTVLMLIDNTQIVANAGSGGGGVRNLAAMRIGNSVVRDNRSSAEGGGIRNLDTLTITNSTIRNNTARTNGGGISHGDRFIRVDDKDVRIGGKLTLSSSAVFNNSAAGFGGGIESGSSLESDGFMRLRNSTISGNKVGGGGGGLLMFAGRAGLENCTLAANRGEGISANSSEAQLRLTNSIVAGNTFTNGSGSIDVLAYGDSDSRPFQSGGYNLIGVGNPTGNGQSNATDGFNQSGDRANIVNARLGPLADNGGPTFTHLPALDSPAVNGGDPRASTNANDFDQRGAGFVRVRAGRLDIGAVEVQVDTVPVVPIKAFDDSYELILGAPNQPQLPGVTLQSNGIFFISAPGVLANDTNESTATVTARLARAPRSGRVQVRADGSFYYLPNTGFAGADEFVYILSNGQISETATVRLKIIDQRAPELRFDTPPNGATVKAVTRIAGRVRDKQSGVREVTLQWKRFDGTYWDGGAWRTNVVNLPLNVQGTNWNYTGKLPEPGTDSLRSLLDGGYELTVTATDNSDNVKQMTNRITVKNQSAPVASTVLLSGAFVRTTLGLIQLNFTGALDATMATDKTNYRVTVNGAIVNLSLTNYASNAVTLGDFNFKSGDNVTIQIANLRDAAGKTIAGGTIQLVAR